MSDLKTSLVSTLSFCGDDFFCKLQKQDGRKAKIVSLSLLCGANTEQPFMKTFTKHLLQFEQAERGAVAGQSSYESSVWKYTGISCLQTRTGQSQVSSILKKLRSLNCSRALCFMQPTNTVELVLPVLWYFTLEYLSHSFPFHETMNDAGKRHLNKAASMSLYQWSQINGFSQSLWLRRTLPDGTLHACVYQDVQKPTAVNRPSCD